MSMLMQAVGTSAEAVALGAAVRYYILSSMDIGIALIAWEKTSLQEIMTYAKERFFQITQANIAHEKAALYQYKCHNESKIELYLDGLEQRRTWLTDMGLVLPDEDLVQILHANILVHYQSIIKQEYKKIEGINIVG